MPTTGIVLILGVDRILDMCRTTVNVSGNLTARMGMDRWIGKELAADEPAQAQPEVT